jgi:CelD/BcsL family acetyltransferase involved in cellulose biosynthesis
MRMSVGTIRQWLAIKELFNEAKFKFFDFTEGQSSHKQLFATHRRRCANVYFVRTTLRNAAIIYAQMLLNRLSNWTGASMDRFGVRARIRRFLRFAV